MFGRDVCCGRRRAATAEGPAPVGRFRAAPALVTGCLARPGGNRLLAETTTEPSGERRAIGPFAEEASIFAPSEVLCDSDGIVVCLTLNTLFLTAASCSQVHPACFKASSLWLSSIISSH